MILLKGSRHLRGRLLLFSVAVMTVLGYFIILAGLKPLFAGFHWQYDYIVTPSLFGLFYYFTRRMEIRPQTLLSFSITLFVCGFVLSELWGLGASTSFVFAGHLPYSDAKGYLNGALNLINAGQLSVWESRRPLLISWLSLSLFLAGGNLRGTLALTTLFGALGIALVSGGVRKSLGNTSGWMVHVLSFFWYRTFIGTTLSENTGFFFGCIGFSLLWKAVNELNEEKRRDFSFLTGLFALSIGLLARAGTFFVLPCLVVWYALKAMPDKRAMARKFVLSGCVILLAFGLNNLILRVVGHHENAFGNFSTTLYGLVHGSNWTQAEQDHPEFLGLPETERFRLIYDLSLKKIRESPMSLIKGSLRAYAYFLVSQRNAYSFTTASIAASIDFDDLRHATLKEGLNGSIEYFRHTTLEKMMYIVSSFSWFIAAPLLAFGGLVKLARGSGRYRGFLLFAGLGIVLSVPFLPPWDAGLMRVYIASAPFFAVLPAIFLARNGKDDVPVAREHGAVGELFALFVCLSVFAFPFVMRANSRWSLKAVPDAIKSNTEVVKVISGSVILPEHSARNNFLSKVDVLVDRFVNGERIRMFHELDGNDCLGYAYFPGRGSSCYVYWDLDQNIEPGRWIEVEKNVEGDEMPFLKKLELPR